MVISTPAGPVGLLVAAEIGRRQVAARELGALLDGAPHVTGAALLGGGDVVVLVEPARMAARSRLIPEPAGPRPRVLVVDDSRGVRQVVGRALGLAGFDVDLAGSPTEALSALAGQRYDAIVMDYVMPTMDGASLVRKVRGLGHRRPGRRDVGPGHRAGPGPGRGRRGRRLLRQGRRAPRRPGRGPAQSGGGKAGGRGPLSRAVRFGAAAAAGESHSSDSRDDRVRILGSPWTIPRSSPISTRRSARRWPPPKARCWWWPAPARARPGCSPTASPT